MCLLRLTAPDIGRDFVNNNGGKTMKKLTLILAAMVAGYMTPPAFAQSDSDSGFYVGGGGGIGKISDICDGIEDIFDTVNSCDNKSTAWRIFGGYQFNPYLGAEVEYAFSNSYEIDITHDFGGTLGELTFSGEADLKTFGISAIARYPFNDSFSVFGRGGVHFWEQESNISGTTIDQDGTDLLLGGGIEFRPTDGFGVRLEHARYFGDDSDLDTTTLQLVLYL